MALFFQYFLKFKAFTEGLKGYGFVMNSSFIYCDFILAQDHKHVSVALCISPVSSQPVSLESPHYVSIPAALKISRGHQILDPPKQRLVQDGDDRCEEDG